MKNLIRIVSAKIQQALADALRGLKEVEGFTFTTVEGHGPSVRSFLLPRSRSKFSLME